MKSDAADLVNYSKVEMQLTGAGEDGFDDAVFKKLAAGTWTAQQAEDVWTYTDGYSVDVKVTVAGTMLTHATTGGYLSAMCFTKTAATNTNGQKADGWYCFEHEGGIFQRMFYRALADVDTSFVAVVTANDLPPAYGGATRSEAKWGFIQECPMVAGLCTTAAAPTKPNPDVPYHVEETAKANVLGEYRYSTEGYAARAPFFKEWSPANSTAGLILTSAVWTGVITFGWYQPKHQEHDYYKNNFRLNKGDTVQMGAMASDTSTTDFSTLYLSEQWVIHTAVPLTNSAMAGLAATGALLTTVAALV